MRILIVLKTKKFAVADTHVYLSDNGYNSFELATGGIIDVPNENVDYILRFDDRNMDMFRQKHQQLWDNDEYEAI